MAPLGSIRAPATLFFGIAGLCHCGPSTTLVVPPAWPPDQVRIVLESEHGELVRAHAFAPGAPIILEAPDGAHVGLTVLTYPPTEDERIDPVRCGVKIEKDNPIVPSPIAGWSAAPAEWNRGAAPAFEPVVGMALDELTSVFAYDRCVSDPFDCSRLTVDTVPTAAIDGDMHALEAVDDDLVFYELSTGELNDRNQFHLYRAELPDDLRSSRQTVVTATGALPVFRATGLAFDGRVVQGRTSGGESFAVTLEGQLTRGPRHMGYTGIAIGDGVAYEHGSRGLREVGGTNTTSTSITGVQSMAIIDRNRIVATSSVGLLSFDGNQWAIDDRRYKGQNWRISADESLAVAVQKDGAFVERVGSSRVWVDIGSPLGQYTDVKAIIVLPEGRWIAGAQDSALMVKLKNGRTCTIPAIGPNNFTIGAISPSGHTVFLGLNPTQSITGDRGILVRIRLPAN